MNVLKSLKENMKQGKEFRNKMNVAFRDLRADFDVSTIYSSKEKLKELKSLNIDILDNVSSLATSASKTNGLIAGSRGTGKSHLFLLARDNINSTGENFCVYINLKEHLKINGKYFVDERFYTWIILNQFIEQLEIAFINTTDEEDIIDKIFSHFNRTEKKKKTQFKNLYIRIKDILKCGETSFHSFNSKETFNQNNEVTSNAKVNAKLSIKDAVVGSELSQGTKESVQESKDFETYGFIDLNTLKKYIIQLKELLNLKSVIFFYDEWSILEKKNQDKLSELIRGLSISPIFHWIAYIPYMTSLGVLEKAADFTSNIELDRKYIYEENKEACLKYFRKFANKRLEAVFGSNIFNIDSLLSNANLDILVKAGMGNTRDFGVILNYCWDNYKDDYLSGKEYERFNLKRHVYQAIKKLGEDKESNLSNSKSKYTKKLWIEIQKFVDVKKYTHFCIEDSTNNANFINDIEFQELMYYRILHLRKKGVSRKNSGGNRLDLYACDISGIFSKIFETKSQENRIEIVTNSEVIHDKIRRYIFDLANIMNDYRVQEGKQIICQCKRIITSDMELAWELGMCPFCKTPFK